MLRGSQDGFTPKKFHKLCDNKPHTVTFIKVKGAEEIIGGYNPLKWETSHDILSYCFGKTKDSFIYSFKIENNFIKDAIISNVVNTDRAMCYHPIHGPHFGSDIIIHAFSESVDYSTIWCRKHFYEKK